MCLQGEAAVSAPAPQTLKRAAFSSPGGWLGWETPPEEDVMPTPRDLSPTPMRSASSRMLLQPAQVLDPRRRRRVAGPLMLLLLLLGVTLLFMRCLLADGEQHWDALEQAGGEADAEAAKVSEPRTFLQEGSLYQNEYMTLWNTKQLAISVQLRILPGDHFQMLVEHLDSVGGGASGWFSVRGSFRAEPIPGAPAGSPRLGLVASFPTEGRDSEGMGFTYDESILEPSSRFVFRCLRGLGASGLMKAMKLEVDTAKDSVMVAPRASVIRMLWDEEFALRKTAEESLWKPGPPGEKLEEETPAATEASEKRIDQIARRVGRVLRLGGLRRQLAQIR